MIHDHHLIQQKQRFHQKEDRYQKQRYYTINNMSKVPTAF